MKNYACHRLYTAPSVFLRTAFVSIDETGRVKGYNTLQTENAFTEWIGGIIFLSGKQEISPKSTLNELLQANMHSSDGPSYAWHISHFDFINERMTPQSIIRRLI